MVDLEATNGLHTAILSAICNQLGRDPAFSLEVSGQLAAVQGRLEASMASETVLKSYIKLRRDLGL